VTGKSAARYARYAEAVNTIVGYPSETVVREQADVGPRTGSLLLCVRSATGETLAFGQVAEAASTENGLRLTLVQPDQPAPTLLEAS
jgi:hypothetical protein